MSSNKICAKRVGAIRNEWQNGFHVEFDNGIVASVQAGRGNYCDEESVEVAAFYADELDEQGLDEEGNPPKTKWAKIPGYTDGYDDVMGYAPINQIPDFLIACRDYKPE